MTTGISATETVYRDEGATALPGQAPGTDAEEFRRVATRIATAQTRGELGAILAEEIGRYTLADLQVIGGRLYAEMVRLPRPYRDQVHPYITEQILGAYHRLLLMHRAGTFASLTGPIADRETFAKFCTMIPDGCFRWDEAAERTPFPYTPRHRFFYYLVSAFTIFLLDRPGHPVGMPFPGGYKVEERNGTFYCLIRDHEKEVPFSICNFCPACQTPGV
ncbi:DUF2115 domain-containing protein [Methanoregula sp.]|uniref:DUF2115 domain-containing protein n=1 Tax=Methanoregula sp. TaxID=2052170 RepID=UPI002BC8621C|nr:DUF2115 domain-containing protein [Methanoregula sp.]HVP96264.1 DUF2115 domain-containing protein [Methanoregula sp.]